MPPIGADDLARSRVTLATATDFLATLGAWRDQRDRVLTAKRAAVDATPRPECTAAHPGLLASGSTVLTYDLRRWEAAAHRVQQAWIEAVTDVEVRFGLPEALTSFGAEDERLDCALAALILDDTPTGAVLSLKLTAVALVESDRVNRRLRQQAFNSVAVRCLPAAFPVGSYRADLAEHGLADVLATLADDALVLGGGRAGESSPLVTATIQRLRAEEPGLRREAERFRSAVASASDDQPSPPRGEAA